MIENYPFWEKKEEIEKSMKTKTKELKEEMDKSKELIPKLLAQKTWEVLSKTKEMTTYQSKFGDTGISAIFARKTLKTKRSPKAILTQCLKYYTEPVLTKEHLPFLHPYFPYYYSYHIEKDVYVIHCRFASGTRMVWDRDYVNVRDIVKKTDDHMYFISCSVPESLIGKDWPKDPDCVRGHLTVYYVSARRVNDEEIFFEYLSHSNPNGWIPSKIINWKAKEEAFILMRYYKLLGKWLDQDDDDEEEKVEGKVDEK